MVLPGQSCAEIINAYTRQQWQPLLDLIPVIETTDCFEEPEECITLQDGTKTFSFRNHSAFVSEFLDIVYEIPVIINFNWGAWDDGRKIANTIGFNYDAVDLVTKCRLITAIVRNDRFFDGALIAAFQSGLMLHILKSMEKQIKSEAGG